MMDKKKMADTTCPLKGKRLVGLKLLQTNYKACIHLTTLFISQLHNKLTGIETTFAKFVRAASQNSEVSCKMDVGCCCRLQKKGGTSVPMAPWLCHCFAMLVSEDLHMWLNTEYFSEWVLCFDSLNN